MDALIGTITANSAVDYLAAVSMFAVGGGALWLVRRIFDRKVKSYLENAEFRLRGFVISVVEEGALPVLYFAVFYASASSLHLDARIERVMHMVGLLILSFFAARIAARLIDHLFTGEGMSDESAEAVKVIPKGVATLIKFAIWTLAAVFLLDNLGFNITTLVAGLGIGGVALALATQAILGDLFNYFVILFDKPFQKGDFIIVGDKLGEVQYIGLKTTRLRSLSGEELVFSNTDLTNSRVHNYKRMERRRAAFKIGVTYQTQADKLRRLPGMIKEIIDGVEDAAFDRSHFSSFGDFALVIETVYYVTGPDYAKYMDIQQRINFTIMEEFEKLGVEFAYPTQTVYLKKES